MSFLYPSDEAWSATPNAIPLLPEMQQNANIIYWWGKQEMGFTDVAISALLGNCEHESWLNPSMFQGRTDPSDWETTGQGYGLTQWTPARMYLNWAGGAEWIHAHHSDQLKMWKYESQHPHDTRINEWYPPVGHREPGDMFNVTWQQWGAGWSEVRQDYSLTVSEATEIFMENYLRPGIPNLNSRISKANYWKLWIDNGEPTPLPQHLPIWLLLALKKGSDRT